MDSNFRTTSVFCGGKFINFFETGDRLYNLMCQAEKAFGVPDILHHGRKLSPPSQTSLGVARSNEEAGKALGHGRLASPMHSAFTKLKNRSSLMSPGSGWASNRRVPTTKLKGTDSRQLTHELRGQGIRPRGSTVIGLEQHMPDNIGEEIEYAVDHNSDFHHFAVYTPMPGTLHKEMFEQGCMLDSIDLADIHGQDGQLPPRCHVPRGSKRFSIGPAADYGPHAARSPADRGVLPTSHPRSLNAGTGQRRRSTKRSAIQRLQPDSGSPKVSSHPAPCDYGHIAIIFERYTVFCISSCAEVVAHTGFPPRVLMELELVPLAKPELAAAL